MDITHSQSAKPTGKTPIINQLAQKLAQTGDENRILRNQINQGLELVAEGGEKIFIEVAKKHGCSVEEIKAMLKNSNDQFLETEVVL